MGEGKSLEDFKNFEYQLEIPEVNDRKVTIAGNTALVTGESLVEGHIGENPLSGRYRFMRVWGRIGGNRKVVAVATCGAKG